MMATAVDMCNVTLGEGVSQSASMQQNTIVGNNAGACLTTDIGHVLVGYYAGNALTNAQSWNTFVGHYAAHLAVGAGCSVAVGRAAGHGMRNDSYCTLVGHAPMYYYGGGICVDVSAYGNQSGGAPVDGTGTNWQGSGLTYFGAINDVRVCYLGSYTGKSSADARTNATAVGALARLPMRDNVMVLGHGMGAVETAGRIWQGWDRVNVAANAPTVLTAAQMTIGMIVRTGALTADATDTTDSAANIVANGPGQNCETPCAADFEFANMTDVNITIAGGAGVVLSSLPPGVTIASGATAKFKIQVANSTPGQEAVVLYRLA